MTNFGSLFAQTQILWHRPLIVGSVTVVFGKKIAIREQISCTQTNVLMLIDGYCIFWNFGILPSIVRLLHEMRRVVKGAAISVV